jgi:Flp pilus assembly pilin Flp
VTVANRRDVMSATTTHAREDGASKQTVREYLKREEGLTTAEYAVGTVAVAGLGGVLIKLLTSEAVRDLIWTVVQGAFNAMLGA